MKATNITNKKEIAGDIAVARSVLRRMKGLIGRKGLEKGEALWIKPCKSVHTIGMRFPIDLLFLDKENIVVALKKNLLPNRMTGFYLHASSVLELPTGTLAATNTQIGDRIEIA